MKNKLIFIACLAVVGMTFTVGETVLPESYSITAQAADKTVSGDLTLESDMTVDGDLILTKGTLDLNGHKLTVKGNFLQKGGYFIQGGDGGSLKVTGSYKVTGDGAFYIWNGSVLDIDGDVVIDSTSVDTYYQAAGTLKIGGNLSVYAPYGGSAFKPHGDAVVTFKGKKTHTVYFYENELNSMGKVAVTDGGQLELTGKTTGFTAASDITLADGSTITGSKNLELNGYTVTVDGDFNVAGTSTQVVQVGGSTLVVKGNLIQSSGYIDNGGEAANIKVNGNYELKGDGSFVIWNDSVYDIDGDVIVDSTSTDTYYQAAGTFKIGGNLSVYAPYSGAAFKPHGDAVIEFKGKKTHTVYFYENELNSMGKVAVADGGKLELTGQTTGFIAASDITLVDGSTITGSKNLELNGNTITVDGDFNVAGTKDQVVQVGGSTLIVKGNLLQSSGYIDNGGEAANIKVNGNYELSGDGSLVIWNDSVYDIDGNVIINSTSTDTYYQASGTFRIGGNLSVYAPYGGAAFVPHGDAVVVFKGNNTHIVYFYENELNYMEKVAVTDGGQLMLTGNTTGFVAADDLTLADGSTITGARTMDLNGYTVKVDGDLNIAGTAEQNIQVGGSTLEVYGDLIQSSSQIVNNGDAGNVKVHGNYELTGNGSFEVWHCSVYDIDGDVIINSASDNTNYQGEGTFRIGGDLSVYAPYGGAAFVPHSNAVVEFKGRKIHTVYFDENELNYMEKVAVKDGGQIKLTGNTTGFVAADDLTLADGSTITGSRTMELNGYAVTVDGDLNIAGTADQNIQVGGGTLIVYGNLLQSSSQIVNNGEAGYVKVGGNYELTGNGSFEVWHGSVYDIDGDVIINSSSDNTYYQGEGILRIGGNFSAYAPYGGAAFRPNDGVIVEFKGAKAHEMYFDESKNNYFTTLKLGVGDSVTFKGYIYDLGVCGSVTASVSPKELATVKGATITGAKAGDGKLVFAKGDVKQEHTLIVDKANKETLGENPGMTDTAIIGDVNADGSFNIADLVTMRKWLLAVPDAELKNWEAGDLCKDGKIDVFDFNLMKRELLK